VTVDGTAAYNGCTDLPPLVTAAVAAARRAGFTSSCRPEQGRLLQLLAGGAGAGRIGETGTGLGVGLAWLASGAHPDARLFSIERDPGRARAAQGLFAEDTRVRVSCGDWPGLATGGPFDLLVLDGGGQGKRNEPPLEPGDWLRPGGLVVLDDFTPMTTWPPRHDGQPDLARIHWLEHPRLRTTEIRVTPAAATLVCVYLQ
jgi:predicted O-methyltransferase YrrM